MPLLLADACPRARHRARALASLLSLGCIPFFVLPACRRAEPRAQPQSLATAATVVVPSPPSAAQAPEFPALERERLAYLFEAAELVSHTWPGLAADRTCILLLAQDAQWTVNCELAPSGFASSSSSFRARPVFAHRGGAFAVAGETRSTQQFLELTPAAAHVSDRAASGSGLPPGRPWLVLGTLEALRAFHPAFGPASAESWLSVAIHEFVHIHQLRQREFDAYALRIEAHSLEPGPLTTLYAQDALFRAAIDREYQQLTAAARDPNPAAPRLALRRWLGSYRARSKRVARLADGQRLLEAERVFMYLEGVARFVESDFLANTGQHPAQGLEADPQFHRFDAFVGRGYLASPNRQLDIQYYYAIGYHVCVLLDRIDPGWKQRVDKQVGWLIGLVEALTASGATPKQ